MITLIFLFVCSLASAIEGFAKAIRDTLDFHYFDSVFTKIPIKTKKWYFFNTPEVMSKNKYKNRDDIKREPAFFGSTTFFVFLTDGWHLSEFIIMLFNYVFAISFAYFVISILENPCVCVYIISTILICWVIRNYFFFIFFDKILKLKK